MLLGPDQGSESEGFGFHPEPTSGSIIAHAHAQGQDMQLCHYLSANPVLNLGPWVSFQDSKNPLQP